MKRVLAALALIVVLGSCATFTGEGHDHFISSNPGNDIPWGLEQNEVWSGLGNL